MSDNGIYNTGSVVGICPTTEPVELATYIRGLVSFDVPDIAINSIRIKRGIPKEVDVTTLNKKTLELVRADVLMWASTSYSVYSGTKESDGGWSSQEASKTITASDKKRFAEEARSIYFAYGDNDVSGSIVITNLL